MSNLFPDGWKIQAISEFAKTSAGGTPSTQVSEYWKNGNIPWMSSGEVNKKRIFHVDNNITQLGFENSSAKLFPPKTILMALAGQGKTRGTVAISEIELTTNQSIGAILVQDKNVYPDFVYHNLENRYEELRSVSGGSGRAGLNLSIIGEQELKLPPFPEQQKIAAILSSVDDVIEKTQAQIDKLKDLKTGMMQELLTRGVGVDGKLHTEFKDSPVGRIPKGWDVLQISALCSHIVDCVNKTAPVVDYQTPYKMIRTTNVRHGRVDTDNVRNVTKETYEAWTRRLLPEKGDLIFTREAPVGECGILEDARGIFLGQRTMMYRADETKTSSQFLMYSLMSEYGQQQLKDFSGGSTVPHMRVPDCGKILIKTPSKKEQEIIVNSLGSVDSAIKSKENKLRKVKDTKKALMQDLLTGKVRVKVDS
ncbi:MAG: restriction endonuclease subunit S [Flavobacteriales bacterium]|nr:restriction endonuclease subunit S [Flavobacteriales bacterium]